MSEFRLPPTPIITGNPQAKPVTKPSTAPKAEKSFRELLGQAVGQKLQNQPLTLSKHAMHRVEQRSIELSATDLERMGQAVDKCKDKGVTDTLIYLNNNAFIVNVPSKVVVTVVGGGDAQDNIFTNIDGAVIL